MFDKELTELTDDLRGLGFEKPNCYKCKFRQELGWSAHSQCSALKTIKGISNLNPETVNLLITAGKISVPGVKFHQHGVNNGWANWPSNFDPTWLEECRFYESKD
jgi:hypothetical protein